jgi:hypothetical protein
VEGSPGLPTRRFELDLRPSAPQSIRDLTQRTSFVRSPCSEGVQHRQELDRFRHELRVAERASRESWRTGPRLARLAPAWSASPRAGETSTPARRARVRPNRGGEPRCGTPPSVPGIGPPNRTICWVGFRIVHGTHRYRERKQNCAVRSANPAAPDEWGRDRGCLISAGMRIRSRPRETSSEGLVRHPAAGGIHRAQISYCHWKSNELEGDTDLDVPVDRSRSMDLQQVLAEAGFERLSSNPLRANSAIKLHAPDSPPPFSSSRCSRRIARSDSKATSPP